MNSDGILGDHFIRKALGNDCPPGVRFSTLGLSNSQVAKTLTFLDDTKFLQGLISNTCISGVFTTSELAEEIRKVREDITVLVTEDPRYDFFYLQNCFTRDKKERTRFKSVISATAQIHETAFVSPWNVIIGEQVVIEPNVTVLSDVELGDHCYLRAGAVLGTEGFEHKRTSKGILSVMHDGKVIAGNHVEFGANCVIAKGFAYRDTRIGDFTKIDNLVHIAHAVHIGNNCFLPACCMVSGSVTIGDNVWIGPNASIAPQIHIRDNAYITFGSVVVGNVKEGQKVTGNFAIDHEVFLKNYWKSRK